MGYRNKNIEKESDQGEADSGPGHQVTPPRANPGRGLWVEKIVFGGELLEGGENCL